MRFKIVLVDIDSVVSFVGLFYTSLSPGLLSLSVLSDVFGVRGV